MTNIRSTVKLMAAGLGFATAVLCAGIARADGPTFTIVNSSGDTADTATYYYLGVGTDKQTNSFMILMNDGTWIAAGSDNNKTQWNPTGYNPNVPAGNPNTGAGVVPCYKIKGGETVNVPPNLVGARIYFFRVPSQQKFGSGTNPTRVCNAKPATTPKTANGIFGNVNVPVKGGAFPFAYFSTSGNGNYVGASPANIIQFNPQGRLVLPAYTFSEVAGPDPTAAAQVADIDASQVDLIGFPTNIIAQMVPQSPLTSVPQQNVGVGFSSSPNGDVNMKAVTTSFDSFAKGLSGTDAIDYPYLHVTIPNDGGSFLVNPGNYLTYMPLPAPPKPVPFRNHFRNLVQKYMWNPILYGKTGWTGTIDLGGAISTSCKPAPCNPAPPPVPQLTMTGTAVKLGSAAFPNYNGSVYAIKFSATYNNETFVAYVLSPISYSNLCSKKALTNCPAQNSPANQIFAGAGALGPTQGTGQFAMLKRLNSKAANVWAKYDNKQGGQVIYSNVVARLGLIISNAFNRGVAGGLPTANGLCASPDYGGNISYCWSDQKNWYPHDLSSTQLKQYWNGDITQNQFARWLHTSAITPDTSVITAAGESSPIPIMTQPTNPITTNSGDVMGMAYGFSFDENPTPQIPTQPGQLPTPQAQTPAEYSSNVLSDATSSPLKNCITILPYDSGKTVPQPTTDGCVRQDP